MSKRETYGYPVDDNFVEVVLTKRKAGKNVPAMGNAESRTDYLYEITPVDPNDGSWKKLVRLTDLYKFEDSDDE